MNEKASQNMKHVLNGLILAGGYSRRMGTDKSRLVFNGKPQRDLLFELLAVYCREVFTSCRKEQDFPDYLHPLVDSYDVSGPLNGILSAFKHQRDTAWLTVAVDMPFVDSATLELLISNRDQSKLATCFYNAETNLPEPLVTIWESEAYPLLLKFADGGNISPREFLNTHPIKMINPPRTQTLLNVNYPDQL